MSIDADWLVDRRRLKRRLTAWQVAAVLAALLAVAAVLARFGLVREHAYVVRLTISGVIVDDPDRNAAIAQVADDTSAKALIVRINSPGGTVVGGEALYRQLQAVAETKPVVAVMGELATSAAYMTAIASDYVFARDGTLTGSIGVIMQTADVTGLLERLGIKPETIKSSPLKAQPNPLETFTPEAREATRKLVADVYEMFATMVSERRKLTPEKMKDVADGRVFTGRQAKDLGLIDAIGGEREARVWLANTHDVALSLPIHELDISHQDDWLSELFGQVGGKALFPERLSLDGLVSVWHPSL
ncbi:MAG: signal peptide peptidase SppA [Rhodospirillales bacterium]|nr:signal peptide peptidase SppA [Rhodospirillales bacterium]